MQLRLNSFLPLLALSLLLAGCQRELELTYTPSADVQELSDPEQADVKLLLVKFYGTPSDPALRVLAQDAPEEIEPPEEDPFPFELESKLDPDHLKLGAQVYQDRCASCHGVTGDGNGPAAEYLDPKPRDYREGIFKFTSTGRSKPRKADLMRTVKYGARGTSMPSFRWLDQKELSAVVDYVIVLAQRGEVEGKLVVLTQDEELEYAAEDARSVYESWKNATSNLIQPITPPPPKTEAAIVSGRHEFLVKGCAKCHGANAQGFTTFAMKDDWGNDIHAANLTSGMLHGGRRDIDVYRRIYSGINGTPMPAFGPEFSPAYKDHPEKIWHLTYYVLAMADGREFPYVSDAEATRMAADELAKDSPASVTEPMPEVESSTDTPDEEEESPAPMPEESQTPDSSTPETSSDDDAPSTNTSDEILPEDPRKATPQPPVVE